MLNLFYYNLRSFYLIKITMDFTPELSAFQGAIMSADNVHPFSKLTSKGGNEEKIQFIINTLLKFLKGTDFFKDGIIESIATLRKFALYIVFNADLTILEDLVDKEEMDLFIWTTPIIPTCLMCELFWNLHMEAFVYEIIAFSFPPLSLELAGVFLDHFKYFSPTECLGKLRKLTTACYTAICRLNFFEFEQNTFSKNLSNAFTNFKKSVKYFIEPPNSHKLNSLSEDELYKYQGNCLYSALYCVYDCSILYTSKQERKLNGIDNIYELTYLKGSVKEDYSTYNISDNPKEILELLDNCHNLLLDSLKALFMDIVTVNTFCAWDEFEENGKTMQQTIGELCYKLRIKLMDISCFSDHPIVGMIEQIAREPVGIKELIHSLDAETIIDNINKNNNEKKDWLHALINKQELCKHTNLLEIIDANLVNYNEEECYKLYEILKSSSENKDITKELSIKVFQSCSITDKYKILNDTFINNCFVNMEETIEFNNMLTKIFNKLIISPNTHFTDILMLFLQNPQKVYIKIFSLAIENSQQTDIMLRAMNLLERFSNYHYDTETESCIIKVIHNTIDLLETEVKQNNFVQFVHGLKEINVIKGSELLMLIIMPNIHKSLLSKNIDNINIQIRLLLDVYILDEIVEYRAPILAMLSQVLSVVRWQIDTFTPVAPETLQLVLLFQKSLVTTYNNNIPENEGKWLKSKLRNLQPLNMYYYRQLWNPLGSNFLQVISGKDLDKETSTDEIIILLTQILCSCSQQEWCDIWDSLIDFNETSILNFFHQAMSAIVMAESAHRTNNTWQCLLFCYRNLIHIIRYKFIKEPLSDDQIMTVIKIITTIPILKEGELDEIESLLLPLFSYLAERRSDYSIDLSSCIELKQKNLENLVSQVFSNKDYKL